MGAYDDNFVVLKLALLGSGQEGYERERKCNDGGEERQNWW